MSEHETSETSETTDEETARELLDRVHEIISPYLDDYYPVTDCGIGNREYGNEAEVWVLGNWNPKRFPREGDAPLTEDENLGPRLAEQLEEIGAEIHWLDEWVQCEHCWMIFRTEPDSYMWQMSGIIDEDGVLCSVCARDPEFLPDLVEPYINSPTRALTWATRGDLASLGFALFSDRHESGWHPGQDADPKEIYAEARKFADEVIFMISEVSQFYTVWECWTREHEDEETSEDETENTSTRDEESTK